MLFPSVVARFPFHPIAWPDEVAGKISCGW
jgi:hypothetical protein